MSRRPPGKLVPLGTRLAAAPSSAGQSSSAEGTGGSADQPFPIVIIDPLTLFRRGLALLVRQWHPSTTVFDASDISQATIGMGIRLRPELVLVDSILASRWNFAGLIQLLGRLPSTPIILLADELDTVIAAGAIEIGARGYVCKAASEDVLRHALALAASGEIYLPRECLRNVAGTPAVVEPPGVPGSPLQRLTFRQREVLSHLAHGRSNKEIARCLGLLESTVKVHVKTILKKLAATNRTQAAMLAVEMGWARRMHA